MNREQSKKAVRTLVDLAIESGRELLSSQTNFLHHFYSGTDEPCNLTIPVYENLLFALALFRSRKSDNVIEARDVLDRILHYQNNTVEPVGNFPVYLHQFPKCYSRLLGVDLLYPLYWIYRRYHQILGEELKRRLKRSLLSLFRFTSQSHQGNPGSYVQSVKVGAIAIGIGRLFEEEETLKFGEETLERCVQIGLVEDWFSPANLGEIFVALQVPYSELKGSSWEGFLSYLAQTYYSQTNSYAGPSFGERIDRYDPEVTLYDFSLMALTGEQSERALRPGVSLLKGALVQPVEDLFEFELGNWAFLNGKWQIGECWAVSTVDTDDNRLDKGFHLLRLLWGDSKQAFSLVSQRGTWSRVESSIRGGTVELTFTLPKQEKEEREVDDEDLLFYVNRISPMQVLVNGRKSTTFKFEDQLEISMEKTVCSLSFEGGGNSQLFGHIMPGNRPSQLKIKGEDRFKAYDYKIFLRSVRRDEECQVRVKLFIERFS